MILNHSPGSLALRKRSRAWLVPQLPIPRVKQPTNKLLGGMTKASYFRACELMKKQLGFAERSIQVGKARSSAARINEFVSSGSRVPGSRLMIAWLPYI